jgi:hypothetical protein
MAIRQQTQKLGAVQADEHWLPPEISWHKVNADGAFLKETGEGGCGAVLRNHHGEFVAGTSYFLPSVFDPEMAEVMACKKVVQIAKDNGVMQVCLETDCLSVVAKLQRSEKDRSPYADFFFIALFFSYFRTRISLYLIIDVGHCSICRIRLVLFPSAGYDKLLWRLAWLLSRLADLLSHLADAISPCRGGQMRQVLLLLRAPGRLQ